VTPLTQSRGAQVIEIEPPGAATTLALTDPSAKAQGSSGWWRCLSLHLSAVNPWVA
jgi:hypothetical protein